MLQGRELVPAVPPCLTRKVPLRFLCSELPHPLLPFGFHPPELANRENTQTSFSSSHHKVLILIIIC